MDGYIVIFVKFMACALVGYALVVIFAKFVAKCVDDVIFSSVCDDIMIIFMLFSVHFGVGDDIYILCAVNCFELQEIKENDKNFNK